MLKLVKIRGTRYGINGKWIKSPEDGLSKFLKCEFQYIFSFSCNWEQVGKVFSKSTVKFWHNIFCMVNSFALYYIWQLWLITHIEIIQSSARENVKSKTHIKKWTKHWMSIIRLFCNDRCKRKTPLLSTTLRDCCRNELSANW